LVSLLIREKHQSLPQPEARLTGKDALCKLLAQASAALDEEQEDSEH
jgi:hypothetical protein